jgi:ubiquinone/menaquinone biosynthesis C-methylase UbiE
MGAVWQTVRQLVSPGGIEGIFALRYAQFARDTPAMRDEYRRLARRIAAVIETGQVLEIGPGPGFVAIEIARLLPSVRVIGLDLSPTMVEVAIRNAQVHGLSDRVRFRRGDASAMPFDAESFDFVVSSGSLHHWEQPLQIFREIHRVLKPGCRGLVADLRADARPEDVQALADQIDSRFMRWGLRHSFREGYTAAEAEQLIQGVPFVHAHLDTEGIHMEIWLEKGHSADGRQGR